MKKILTILIVTLVLVGCGVKNKKEEIKSVPLPDEITDISWHNESDENEIIYFGSDGHFSYYETSGNAVDDYDLCESYKYDGKIIHLICFEEGLVDKINIDSYSSDKLSLDFDGKKVSFKKAEE